MQTTTHINTTAVPLPQCFTQLFIQIFSISHIACRQHQEKFPHRSHQLVPLGEDLFEEKKVHLQQMIQKRREKLEEIREAKAEGVEMFTALMELVQRGLKELMKTMEEEQEVEERELSHSEDHLLQHFFSLKAPPMMMIKMLEMKRLQQFAVDVTLDPLTSNPYLVLSDDGKQVYCSDVWKNLPDNPKRFSKYINVLGKQSFSSGRFYFEVQVKGKTDWNLGVVEESINRKEYITATPKNGLWTVALRDGNVYAACGDPPVILHLKCVPEKVGVFVDYEKGVVSFYDVDAAALIYSFTHCCFTHKLHPYFSPGLNHGGKNSAPLIICPVNQSE
uniref:B30.2/SPRY domain-containing protein n=1 Tax=Gouania willdenowi TaxID=441366 RepID=A0A8C5DSQ3_GOUWI